MSLTRRRIIGTAASITTAGLLEGQQLREEPSVLKGTTSDGKVVLPPLQSATQLGGVPRGVPPNPDPVGRRMGVAVVGLGYFSLEQFLPDLRQAKHIRVTALVSGDLTKANAIGLQYGVQKHETTLGLRTGIDHSLCISHGGSHGLLTEHMLTDLRGSDRVFGM